jgi:hypothetical protein
MMLRFIQEYASQALVNKGVYISTSTLQWVIKDLEYSLKRIALIPVARNTLENLEKYINSHEISCLRMKIHFYFSTIRN